MSFQRGGVDWGAVKPKGCTCRWFEETPGCVVHQPNPLCLACGAPVVIEGSYAAPEGSAWRSMVLVAPLGLACWAAIGVGIWAVMG